MISKQTKQNIEQEIYRVYQDSNVQIIPAYTNASALYLSAHYKMALITMILFSGLYYLTTNYLPILSHFESTTIFFLLTLCSLLIGHFLAYIPKVKKLLTSNKAKRLAVYQNATQIYFEQEIPYLNNGNSILILVSFFEKRLQILAGPNINKDLTKQTWSNSIDEFKNETNDFEQSFIKLIQSLESKFKKGPKRSQTTSSEQEQAQADNSHETLENKKNPPNEP